MKKKTEKILFMLGTKGICLILFLIGLLCVTFSFVSFKDPFPWWEAWGKSVSNTLGTTLIASCVISLVFEISNINSVFQNILGNVLNDEFPIEAYSNENLIRFKNRICLHQCKEGMKQEQLLNSIYKYEKDLLDLSNSIYYEYHNASYVIEPREKEGIFKVDASIEYEIVNRFGDDNLMRFKIRTYSISEKSPEEDYENNFKINKFEINGKKVENPEVLIENIDKEVDSNFYDYKVKITKDLGKKKNVTIIMNYTYNMPISDQIQSYKVTLPCKKLEHKVRIKQDRTTGAEWQIKANAFTAFYYKQKEGNSKFRVEQTGNDHTRVRYDDWTIPGGGYVLYFGKNSFQNGLHLKKKLV